MRKPATFKKETTVRSGDAYRHELPPRKNKNRSEVASFLQKFEGGSMQEAVARCCVTGIKDQRLEKRRQRENQDGLMSRGKSVEYGAKIFIRIPPPPFSYTEGRVQTNQGKRGAGKREERAWAWAFDSCAKKQNKEVVRQTKKTIRFFSVSSTKNRGCESTVPRGGGKG